MSTGIRTRLLTPTTAIIRRTTTMKYGFRIANRDIHSLLRFGAHCDDLRLHLLARLQPRTVPDHHQISLIESGAYFNQIRSLDPKRHFSRLDPPVRTHHHDASTVVDRADRCRERVVA